jgi:hypothetical protein
MQGYKITIGMAAAAFALSFSPVQAQERSRPADSPSVGSATPRDSGSSSGSSSSSSSGGSSSTSSSGSNNSGSSNSAGWSGSSGNNAARRAPVNPERTGYGDQRRAGSSASTVGQAVPRNEAGGSGDSTALATPSAGGVDRQAAPGRNLAVPAYSRPRDGRPAIGAATERPDGYYADGHPYYYSTYIYNPYYGYYYDPFYPSYYRNRYYWSPWGYGFGFGYMAYDPFFFGAYGYPGYYGMPFDPYDPSYGGGYGGGGGYYGGGGGGGYSSSQVYHGAGSLRLKVKPGNAQVFVDGYFVGTVDSFDGVFQRLSVEAGAHKIELRADGYQTTTLDVMVIPNDTVTYEGRMIRK